MYGLLSSSASWVDRHRRVVYPLVLVGVSLVIFFTNLGQSRLWDRDEPRNAGCAAEMLARGDWVVPTFNDELRHQKPVLLYWLIMSAFAAFGQSEFAARFWSAALATGTVLATYGIATRLANRKVGLIAGIVLASSLMFDVAARAATPDSVLIFCATSAIWIFVVGTFRKQEESETFVLRNPGQWFPQNGWIVVAFYVMLGLGVLAKGPVGFLLPMAMIGWFMLIQRLPEPNSSAGNRWIKFARDLVAPFHPVHFLKTLWTMRPLIGAAVVLLVAAPWYLMVHARTDGDFTQMFFVGEHFGRATTAMENHSGGLWFYPLAILVGFFPWSVFWGPVTLELIGERKRIGRLDTLTTLSLCMVVIQVSVFSLAQTKLPSYVTPCYPALAMLTGACLVKWSEARSSISTRWYSAALASLCVGGILVAAGLGVGADMFFPQHRWLALIGLVPVVGGAVALWQFLNSQNEMALRVVTGTSVLFCVLLFGVGTVAIDSVQQSDRVLNAVSANPQSEIVASYRTLESSWVYYGGKPIYECLAAPDSGGTGSLERENWWQSKPRLTPERMVELDPSVQFITLEQHVDELQSRLPDDYRVTHSADYFLKNKRIVLLEPAPDRTAKLDASNNTTANTH